MSPISTDKALPAVYFVPWISLLSGKSSDPTPTMTEMSSLFSVKFRSPFRVHEFLLRRYQKQWMCDQPAGDQYSSVTNYFRYFLNLFFHFHLLSFCHIWHRLEQNTLPSVVWSSRWCLQRISPLRGAHQWCQILPFVHRGNWWNYKVKEIME